MENEFVPSYKNEEERLEIRKKQDKKNKIIFTMSIILIVIVAIAVIFLGYTLININYSKYEKYEDKMDIYQRLSS